ncbi:MAG TPA: hypothetical protein VJ824_12050 [Bacillota bacterium]|nr:hypothetical protein [Bacillota bacterium]
MNKWFQLKRPYEKNYDREIHEFGFHIAIGLLEKGKVIKQKNSKYGYKLVRNPAYGSEEYRIAVVNHSGKVLSYTTLNTDQLIAKNWQEMKVYY